jgi:hypothetical protein
MRGISDQDHPAGMPVLEFINFVTRPNKWLKVIRLRSRKDLRNRESPVVVTALDLPRLSREHLVAAKKESNSPRLTSAPLGFAIRLLPSREFRALTT